MATRLAWALCLAMTPAKNSVPPTMPRTLEQGFRIAASATDLWQARISRSASIGLSLATPVVVIGAVSGSYGLGPSQAW